MAALPRAPAGHVPGVSPCEDLRPTRTEGCREKDKVCCHQHVVRTPWFKWELKKRSWQQTGQLCVAGFHLKYLGSGVQCLDVQAIASNWGISQANLSRDKCSLVASQVVDQKANHLKDRYGYGRSSCTPPGKPAWSLYLRPVHQRLQHGE